MIPDTLLTHRSAPPLSFQRNRLTPPLKMNHHPEDGDDRPDQGWEVGPEQPEAEPRQHRVRNAVPLPRDPGEFMKK
jgi:hypothetical protein